MTEIAATRSIVVEREMPHPPDKIWRALTEGPLIEEVADEERLPAGRGPQVQFPRHAPCRIGTASSTDTCWSSNAMNGFPAAGTLRAKRRRGAEDRRQMNVDADDGGTHVRMEQSGFRREDEANYQGASHGRQWFIAGLERVSTGLS